MFRTFSPSALVYEGGLVATVLYIVFKQACHPDTINNTLPVTHTDLIPHIVMVVPKKHIAYDWYLFICIKYGEFWLVKFGISR